VLKIFKPALFVLVAAISLAVITTLSLYAAGAFPYRVYLIHTGSMGKTIPSGSLVVVREHQYHVGQVVTFVENDATVTHRLIAINADGIITTKGDANPTADPWRIPKSFIIGGVVRTFPGLGFLWAYIFMTWQGPASLLLLAIIVALLWLLVKEIERPQTEPITA
jgi:signal peptidase